MRELKFIEYLRRQAGNPGKEVKIGIGDDCAVFDLDKKQYLLWAVDMLVDGTHFDLDKTSLQNIGRKAVSVNISDIASMGGTPKYITVSIGVPSKFMPGDLKKIYKGIFDICKRYNVRVVGGDTNRSKNLVIDVSIIGTVRKEKLITRSGAKEKDLVVITGPVRDGKKTHMNFSPRLDISKMLAKYNINSMIDTSDGIAPDLSRICVESRVGCRLYEESISLVKGLKLKDAMYYGESFELLFTVNVNETKKIFRDKTLKKKCFVIGEMVEEKSGRKITGKDGKSRLLRFEGYRHI
ncbi:MAG: thiamine-phosphate kinase [Candidatus Omnitrophica bacterium]|nr:thiamine-phosphate kinase [Candidatus Omnitrophota bacterium]